MASNGQKSVLFVCMGNKCRSPAGESILQHLLDEQGLSDKIRVDSAGTDDYHVGSRADRRMRRHACRRGYELQSVARQISIIDLELFDLVIAMDRKNYRHIRKLHRKPSAKIMLLSHFLDQSWPRDVPDPYFGGPQGFERVLDMIEAACPNIIKRLTSQ